MSGVNPYAVSNLDRFLLFAQLFSISYFPNILIHLRRASLPSPLPSWPLLGWRLATALAALGVEAGAGTGENG